MKKTRKISVIIIFFVLFFIIGTVKTNASSDDLYLKNYEFDVKINTDGNMDVTEIWDIDVEDTNTLYKTFIIDKSKYSGITNVKVTDITNGNNNEFSQIYTEMYHVTKNCYYGLINKYGEFEIAWGIGMDDSEGHRKYKIQYTVQDAILKCNNCAELYWQFIGKDFKIDAKNIKGTITLPYGAENKENIRVWGHTEDLNGEIYVTSNNKVEFTINKFRSGRFVEVRIAMPQNMIESSTRIDNNKTLQSIIYEETKWADEANARRKAREEQWETLCDAFGVMFIIASFIILKRVLKNKQKMNSMEKIIPSEEIEYFREIPDENSTPAEALYLLKKVAAIFSTDEFGKIFSATLLDLALKNTIEFEADPVDKKKIVIRLGNIDNKKLITRDVELLVYEFVIRAFKNKNEITVKELKKYISNNPTKITSLKEKIDSKTESSLVTDKKLDREQKMLKEKFAVGIVGYILTIIIAGGFTVFTYADFERINTFLLGSFFLLNITSIIGIIVNAKVQSRFNVFTQIGVDEHEKWKGLKKYMEEFSLLNEREVPDLVLWEKFLVYATAFGIADKVIKQLKIVYPNIEQMDNFERFTYMSLMVNTDFSSSIVNSIGSSMSSAYSSGSGGGGGFSGGGGFGRRWPEAEAVDKLLQIIYKK